MLVEGRGFRVSVHGLEVKDKVHDSGFDVEDLRCGSRSNVLGVMVYGVSP